jgi:DUF1016 N-terminal domain
MNNKNLNINKALFLEIKQIVEQGRQQVAQAVNVGITTTYWNIGKRIQEDVLQNSRADYGKQIIVSLGRQLTDEYGDGFSAKYLREMIRFFEVFPDFEIVASLMRQLT